VVNNAIQSSRLTPAFVPEVTAVIGKHAGEIGINAAGNDARPGKANTAAVVGVSPGGAAVGGFEDQVEVGVRKATAPFIHARDVQVAVGRVTSDLNVANETGVAHCYFTAPRVAVVRRAADHERAVPYAEIVPGNIHVAGVGRARVVVGPA